MIYSAVVCNKFNVGFCPANSSRVELTEIAETILEHNAIHKIVVFSVVSGGYKVFTFEVEESDNTIYVTYGDERVRMPRTIAYLVAHIEYLIRRN